jgi:hypothetical protein
MLVLTAILSWLLGALMHWWPLAGVRARRRIAFASNGAGLVFLVAALRAEGLREAAISATVIGGETQHTGTALASASLTYYVLTVACLTLGFTGLVFGDRLSRWLAPRFLLTSVAVAWLLTVVRFLLERSAAPLELVRLVGVTWMAPVAGAYFARCLAGEARLWPRLTTSLVAYAFLVRGFVAALGAAATLNRLGTHYDVSGVTEVRLALTGSSYAFEPGSAAQTLWLTLVPQLAVWPLLTVAGGLVGAAAASLVLRGSLPGRPPRSFSVAPDWRCEPRER